MCDVFKPPLCQKQQLNLPQSSLTASCDQPMGTSLSPPLPQPQLYVHPSCLPSCFKKLIVHGLQEYHYFEKVP